MPITRLGLRKEKNGKPRLEYSLDSISTRLYCLDL